MNDTEIQSIRRPHSNLLWLYLLQAAATLIAFPLVFPPLFFKYHTLSYTFDDEGISASWGIIFKREIYLTYKRIQDIHVTRNLFERWMGIGKVEIQTASGRASAELSLEGMEHYAEVRDFLYRKMRGTSEPVDATAAASVSTGGVSADESEVVALLRSIKDDIDAVRQALEQRGSKDES